MKLSSQRLQVNNIDIFCVETGPRDGVPVLLLHGFPDAAFGWRHQFDALAEAGCRVIAPDLRGCDLSSKPSSTRAYRLEHFVRDIECLLDALDIDHCAVVGHDFGGAVAWYFAGTRPHRVTSLSTLNAPHPMVTEQQLRFNPLQQMKSWYVGFLMLPVLPEEIIRSTGYEFLLACLPPLAEAEVELYLESWRRPGAVDGMVNWYRANMLYPPETLRGVDVPTQLVWGQADELLLPSLAEQSLRYCVDGRVHYIEDAGHWVQVEAVKRCNKLLTRFIRETSRAA